MNCWHCNSDLIWGGDHDCEDDHEYVMVTNLSCPSCDALVLVYMPDIKEEEELDVQIISEVSG